MGLMRFLVSGPESLDEEVLERIYMIGFDGLIWRSHARLEAHILGVQRDVDDSGKLFFPWRTAGKSELVLSTCSLIQRQRPYQLEVELARGTVNSIRNQLAIWHQSGLKIPVSIRTSLAEACGYFALAATAQHEPKAAVKHALRAIDVAIPVAEQLAECYALEAIRCRGTSMANVMFGICLGHHPPDETRTAELLSTFNTAVVPIGWKESWPQRDQSDYAAVDRHIQWALSCDLNIFSGPLISFARHRCPTWALDLKGEELATAILAHLRAAVVRYRDRVQLWEVAAQFNSPEVLDLSEEQRLKLVVRAVENVRQLDPRTPLVVGFDQPWGEYTAQQQSDVPPIHLADSLLRADLGISGIVLEINYGYHPGGTYPYGPLEFSRQLDRWSLLRVPILMRISAPSAGGEDPLAASTARVSGEGNSPATQHNWVERFVPLMLAKNSVQVITWNELTDQQRHELPHAGLYDRFGQGKPALQALREIRQDALGMV